MKVRIVEQKYATCFLSKHQNVLMK